MSRMYLLLVGLLGGMLLFGCSSDETETGTGAAGGTGATGGAGGDAGMGGGGSGGVGGGDCTALIDLATWDFNGASLAPSAVANNVIAEDFTSKDGQPTRLFSQARSSARRTVGTSPRAM